MKVRVEIINVFEVDVDPKEVPDLGGRHPCRCRRGMAADRSGMGDGQTCRLLSRVRHGCVPDGRRRDPGPPPRRATGHRNRRQAMTDDQPQLIELTRGDDAL